MKNEFVQGGGQLGKPDFLKAPAPFYSVWNDARNIEILELGILGRYPPTCEFPSCDPWASEFLKIMVVGG